MYLKKTVTIESIDGRKVKVAIDYFIEILSAKDEDDEEVDLDHDILIEAVR
jgi:hypothetical protein